ncbi:MAG: Ig-like domain repeat protein, partial [Bacteroidota bacterium]
MKNKLLFTRSLALVAFIVLLMMPGLGWGQYSGTGTFTKITSMTDLTDGYYVVAYGTTFAMNNTNAGTYFANTAITPSSSVITDPAGAIVWKIQTNATSGGRTIYNEASTKYVSYSVTTGGNTAVAVSSVTNGEQGWTFAWSSTVFTVTNVTSSTRLLQYNTGSPRFACYTSTQQNISLYKMAAASNDQTSKVAAPTTQIAAGDIASTVTTSGAEVDAFKFKISDLATADALATKVTQVKIAKTGTAVLNTAVAGAELWTGGSKITTASTNINANDITFTVASGNLDIATGASSEITLKVYLTSSVTDNSTLVFSVPQTSHGFTADVAGSTFAADFGAAVTGNTMTIRVAATKLLFTTAPSTTACPNTNLATPPVVKATDANGNTDADFTSQVTLTNSGSIGMINYQMNAVLGVANFSTLQFTTIGSATLSTTNGSSLSNAGPTSSIAISVSPVTGVGATNGNAASSVSWAYPASCYDEIIIVAHTSSIGGTPTGTYTANSLSYTDVLNPNFLGGGKVVFNGSTASPKVVTSLTNGTPYYFKIFSRKGSDWSSGVEATATPSLVTSATDYFRSLATGNWGTNATWQSSATGSDPWITATATPTSAANTITIQNGHTVTVAATVTTDQVVIASGGILEANSSLTVNDGAGDDIVIQSGGTLKYSTATSYTAFGSGTPTISNESGGIILATTSGIINNIQNANYIYKNASILEYNSTSAPATTGITFFPNADAVTIPIFRVSGTIGSTVGGGTSTIINGVLEVTGTIPWGGNSTKTFRNGIRGSGTVSQGTAYAFIISGSTAEIGGGTLTLFPTTGALTINSGTVATLVSNKQINYATITINGTLDCADKVLSGTSALTLSSTGILKTAHASGLNGSLTVSGTKTLTAGSYVYNGTGDQVSGALLTGAKNIDLANTAGKITLSAGVVVTGTLTVPSGNKLDAGTFVVSGASGTFNLQSGGTLLTANATGVSGSVTTNTKTFSSGANYEFNGAATGSFATTPTANTVNDLIINNAASVSLGQNITVNGALSLTSGLLSPGSNTITIAAAGAVSNASSSSYVNGKLVRIFGATGSKDFAIGKGGIYRPLSLNYTALSGTSTVTAEQFETTIPGSTPANTTLFATRHWVLSESGSSSCAFNVTLDGTGFSPTHTVKMINGNGTTNTAYAVTTPDYTATGFTSYTNGNFGLGEITLATTTTTDDKAVCLGSTSVDLTATVSPAFSGGTVQFYIDGSTVGSPVAVSTGAATYAYNPGALSAGAHAIRADFLGFDDYLASTSNPGNNKTLTVNALPVTVTVSNVGTNCNSTTLNASNGGDGTIYYQGTTSGGTSTATPSASEVVSTSGTYYFRAQSSAGCWGTEGSAVVTIGTPVTPAVSITASVNPVVTGNSVLFTPAPVNGGTPTYEWFKNNVSDGTGAAYSCVPLNNDHIYVIMTSSLTCVTALTATSDDIIMIVNVAPATSTWNGSVSDNWHDAGNWSNGIPGTATHVTIPAGLSTYPTLYSTGACTNIFMGSSAAGTASLLDNGYLPISGTVTMEHYMTTDTYHSFSPSVSGTSANIFHLPGSTGLDVYLYSHSETDNANSTNGYFEISDINTSLVQMAGYSVYPDGVNATPPQSAWTIAEQGGLNTGSFGSANN